MRLTKKDKDLLAEAYNQIQQKQPDKYTYLTAIRHAQKTKNIAALNNAIYELKQWAKANNATKDPEIIEYLLDDPDIVGDF